MGKQIPLIFLLLSLKFSLLSQACNIIDSLNVNPPNVSSVIAPFAVFYQNNALWVGGANFNGQNAIYKIDFDDNRVDSIVIRNYGRTAESIAVDTQYLWEYITNWDTIYKYSLTSHQQVGAYSLDGRSNNDEFVSIAQNGDTLYFISHINGTSFKFIKSTDAFIDLPGHQDWYISGLVYVNGNLIATTDNPTTGPKVFKINPADFTKDVSSEGDWWLPYRTQLAYDGYFFWQAYYMTGYVYKIASDILTSISINNIGVAISLYPSPATDKLLVESELLTYNKPVIGIFDLLGNNLLSNNYQPNANKVEVNVSSLPSGIYFLRIDADGQSISKKFVKE